MGSEIEGAKVVTDSEASGATLQTILDAINALGARLDRIEQSKTQAELANEARLILESEDEAVSRWFGSGNTKTQWYRSNRPPLPDPKLVRRIIRQRALRKRFFVGDFFADPAWEMLLDLTAAAAEHRRVSVTSLCIASGVPPTTALRWINVLVEAGLIERHDDGQDRRRTFVSLTDKAADTMARFFVAIGWPPQSLV